MYVFSVGGFESGPPSSDKQKIFITFTGLVLIIMYCAISGLAAVYTEYILKRNFSVSTELEVTKQ